MKCPSDTAPYILANILKLFPSSSINTTIIGTTFSHVVISLTAISLFLMRSSNNAASKSGLDDVILDQK